jgi:hypothetical protein
MNIKILKDGINIAESKYSNKFDFECQGNYVDKDIYFDLQENYSSINKTEENCIQLIFYRKSKIKNDNDKSFLPIDFVVEIYPESKNIKKRIIS